MPQESDVDPHKSHMQNCLTLAAQSPPKPSNYRVGAVLVASSTNTVLSTGYTLELPGNTHAEQCALVKYATAHDLPAERVGEVLPPELGAVLYTSMEPCVMRLSGNESCVERILGTRRGSKDGEGGVRVVYCGVQEPETFVQGNDARRRLGEAGIDVVSLQGFEQKAKDIATAGHE